LRFPVVTHGNPPIVPGVDESLLDEYVELFAKTILPSFVLVAVADENLSALL
jgi:hypothetical protein